MLHSPSVCERQAPGSDTVSVTFPALEQHFALLEQQITQLKLQVRQAQQLSNLGTIAALIAHEFNNILCPMQSYASYALVDGDPELTRKALERTVSNSKVLKAMSERLLSLGSAKAPEFEVVSLRQVVDEAVASLCRDLSKDRVRFKCEVDDETRVWGDPLHLQQVFFNVLLNARAVLIKNGGGKLSIGTHTTGDRVAVEIRDNGPGIAPEIKDRIFDPLASTRGAGAKGGKRCGGLGLALCKDIIEECGGKIAADSTPGEGTTFILTLRTGPPDSS